MKKKSKKIVSISLALMLSISYSSTILYAENNVFDTEVVESTVNLEMFSEENKYNGTVEFMNQWTGESSKRVNTTRNFTVATDKLGNPESNPGLFRGAAKIFLGWSDKEPVNNGELADGARLFSTEDTIATVFPNGIPENAKLYGVYFSLNDPEKPIPGDNFGLGFALLSGINKIKINNNKIAINPDMEGNDILPDTKTVELKKEANEDITILDEYSKKDDVDHINEVVLKAQFEMDNTTAMLVYKNPWVGYAGHVLTSGYNANKKDGGNFKTSDRDAGYTYVDLEVNLDPQFTVPEKLYLEFKGYSWRPLYVFGENKTLLNVLNPADDTNLGNNKDSFNTLINNVNPKVKFGVETKGNHKLTIRTIIRHDDENGVKERIEESSITPEPNGTIAEKILENMTLRTLTTKEIKAIAPAKSKVDINKSVIRIDDSVAKTLADTDGVNKIPVIGIIRGMAVADAGKVSFLTLKKTNKIDEVSSNTLSIGYKLKKVSPGGGGSDTPKPKPEIPDRIDGKDRVETAVEVSKELYPNGAKAVILANKDKFSDVLTAVPFSVQINAPILYTNVVDLPEITSKEIQRLGPTHVYINGGTSSVSKEIEENLKKKGYVLHRFNGVDRYDTARLIADRIRSAGNKNVVEIASGEVFPDALSMSMLAVKHNAPILLSKKNDLTNITRRTLDAWDIETIYIAGGKSTISGKIENELRSGFKLDINKKVIGNGTFGKYDGKFSGAKNGTRYGGVNRYETSAIIAKAAIPDATLGIVTSGEIFADALIAGPYAGKHKAPILLTHKNSVPKSVENYIKLAKITKFKAIGGISTLSEYVLTYLSGIKK